MKFEAEQLLTYTALLLGETVEILQEKNGSTFRVTEDQILEAGTIAAQNIANGTNSSKPKLSSKFVDEFIEEQSEKCISCPKQDTCIIFINQSPKNIEKYGK